MYNPLYGMLFRLLGEAAARGFSGNTDNENPFSGMYGSPTDPSDDSPINVEAEVIDSDGKTQNDRIHEKWDSERTRTAGHQLGGHVVFEGSKNYNMLVGVLCALLVFAGAVARIYSLVMGNIFSSVVVPVALGLIPALLFVIVGIVLTWKKGAWKMPFCAVDLLLVFFSAPLMGYGNIFPAALAVLFGFGYMRLREGKKLPFVAAFVVFAALEFFVFGFPGLWM